MRCWWQIFVLCIFWILLLWLMDPCLDLKTDSTPQEKWMDVAPQHCSCPCFKFRQCGCPSGSLNHSVCHHTAGERWFDAVYEKMRGSLMGAAESMRPGAVLWWSDLNAASELGRVWKKLLKVIPPPSMSHFDFFCGTCALMGNSKILRTASLSNNVNQPSMVSRMNQVPVQGIELLGNQTTSCSVSHGNARGQGSWRQVLLLLLQLFDLAWTSDALSEEIVVWEPRHSQCGRFLKAVQFPSRMEDRKDQDSRFGSGSEKQRRWSPYWEDVHQTNRDSVHAQ